MSQMPGDRKFYEKDGLEYARVSTILAETMPFFDPKKCEGLARWRARCPDAAGILARGQRRGTLVHAQSEHFLLDGQVPSTWQAPSVEELVALNIPEYMRYLYPLLEEVRDQNGPDSLWPGLLNSSLLIEQQLFCSYGFAGTPDLRCWFEGKYTVWDYKSARSYREEGVEKKLRPISRYSEAKIQLSSYALMHNLERGDDYPPVEQLAICICYDWCEPFLHLIQLEEIKKHANEFIERFGVYKDMEGSFFPRKILPPDQ